jgi:hypothetical protein
MVPCAIVARVGLKAKRNGGENALALVVDAVVNMVGAPVQPEVVQTASNGFSVVLKGCVGGIVSAEEPEAWNFKFTVKRVTGVAPIVVEDWNSSIWLKCRVPVPATVLFVAKRVAFVPSQLPATTPDRLRTVGFHVK